MAADFRIDMRQFDAAMHRSPGAVNAGARIALGDIKNDWVAKSRDIAPLDTSNLRRQITAAVFDPGASGYIEIEGNATQGGGGGRFNYGYWIHEENAGGRSLLTPGTEKKFLDKSAEAQIDDWTQWLEDEIKSELRKAGW